MKLKLNEGEKGICGIRNERSNDFLTNQCLVKKCKLGLEQTKIGGIMCQDIPAILHISLPLIIQRMCHNVSPYVTF